MFRNEYQGGPYFEVFSAQGKDSLNQWKQPHTGVKKVFDKEVKSFIVSMEGSGVTTRMELPKDSKHSLGLLQRYLILQLCIPKGQDLSVELGISDLTHRRRLFFSTTCQKENHSDPLRGKFPLGFLKRSVWVNLCLDLVSLVGDTMRGQTFKSVESICISGSCRLRRVFTMRTQPPDTTDDEDLYGFSGLNSCEVEDIPKQCQLAPDVRHYTQLVNMTKIRHFEGRGKSSEGSGTHAGSTADLDLSSSGGRKALQESSHIAFGSKVPGSAPPRKGSGKEGGSSGRQSKSSHTRPKPDTGQQDTSPAQSRGSSATQTSQRGERRSTGRERKNSDPGVNTEDPEVAVDKESLRTSHTWTDGAENKEDIPFVKPHPPSQPSSGSRRKPRVKSAGKERTPHTTSYKEDSKNSSSSLNTHPSGDQTSSISQGSQTRVMASEEEEARILSEMQQETSSQLHKRSESESDISSQNTSGVIEGDESITDIINTLKLSDRPKDSDGDDEGEEEDEVYMFSSPPKSAPRRSQAYSSKARKSYTKSQRTRTRRKADTNHTHPESSKPRTAHLESDFHRSENPSSEEETSIRSRVLRKTSPHHNHTRKPSNTAHSVSSKHNHLTPPNNSILQPLRDDYKSPANSQSRMSISKKSLREIPKEELRRSGGQKTYNSTKYQMADLSDSFEAQMLLNLKREAMEEGLNSDEDEPHKTRGTSTGGRKSPSKGLNRSKLHYSDETGSSSDDTSMSTLKSPGSVKHRAHNYQDEMKILSYSNSFLTQSNPRDWGNVFSPPIVTQGGHKNDVSEAFVNDHSPSNAALGSEAPRDDATTTEHSDAEDELDLLYDPVLNCYYDVKTGKYYELV